MLTRETEMWLRYKRRISELHEELKKNGNNEEDKQRIKELIEKYEELLNCFKHSGYVSKEVR